MIVPILLISCKYKPVDDSQVTLLPEEEIEEIIEEVVETPEAEEQTTEEQETDISEDLIEEDTQIVVQPEEELDKREYDEGDLVDLSEIRAKDPDGDRISYAYTEPFDSDGKWQTGVGDAGEHKVTITATDGQATSEYSLIVVIRSKNKPPVIEDMDEITATEGEEIIISPIISDPENDELTVRYTGWMTKSKYLTTYDDAGIHIVRVIVSDGINQVSKEVKITVENKNRKPVIESATDISVHSGEKATASVSARDPDGDRITISYSDKFDKNGVWETTMSDAGSFEIDAIASDGVDEARKEFTVIVISPNKPPVLDLPTKIEVFEGEVVRIDVGATDPEGDEITVKFSGWMTSAEYLADYDDAGEYSVTVTATDGINTVSKDIKIIVKDRNRPPAFG